MGKQVARVKPVENIYPLLGKKCRNFAGIVESSRHQNIVAVFARRIDYLIFINFIIEMVKKNIYTCFFVKMFKK